MGSLASKEFGYVMIYISIHSYMKTTELLGVALKTRGPWYPGICLKPFSRSPWAYLWSYSTFNYCHMPCILFQSRHIIVSAYIRTSQNPYSIIWSSLIVSWLVNMRSADEWQDLVLIELSLNGIFSFTRDCNSVALIPYECQDFQLTLTLLSHVTGN